MAQDVAALGQRLARRYRPRGLEATPSELIQQLGIAIVRLEAPPPAQPHLRSEYTADPPKITLYTDPITALGAAIHANQRFDLMRHDLAEVHLAHELFHHLEFGGRFGPLTREEVEQAAHAFVRELLDLEYDPAELTSV